MFRFLSDTEVTLNELLVACRESLDHYDDAMELTQVQEVIRCFDSIIAERNQFIEQLTLAIRALGDLPSVPDPDKETGSMLIDHLSASLAANDTQRIIEQRLKTEHQLRSLIAQADQVQLDPAYRPLVNSLAQHNQDTITKLQNLHS